MSFKEYLKDEWKLPSKREVKENIRKAADLLGLIVTVMGLYLIAPRLFGVIGQYFASVCSLGMVIVFFARSIAQDYHEWKERKGVI